VRHSLARRALAYTVAASLVSLVVAFGLFWAARSQYAISQRTAQLSRQSVALAGGLEAEDRLFGSPGTDRLREQLFRVQSRLIGAALFVTDAEGNVLRSSGQIDVRALPIDTLGALNGDGARTGVRAASGDLFVLMVAAPVAGSGEYLVAVQPLRDVLVPWQQLTSAAAISLVVAMLVSVLLGWLLARRLTLPLRRLRDGAESIASGDWGAQVPEEGDTEIASLAHSFNEMSAKVAEAYSAQKAFVGDVSHELRTPITSIRGYAQAIVDGTLTSPEDARRAAGVIHAESLRMEEMSHTLLALAALDAESVQPERRRIDVGAFRDAVRERFDSVAGESQVSLELEIADAPEPVGDFERLLQAASAVVSNGLWYAPSGGTVRIRTLVEEGRWRLQVDDSGPGIPPERRDAVFERFVRLDPSRSKGSGGVGLGLAIARRAVELMGGTITADASEDLGGARFVIELPLAGDTT
jgi:two-component system sensor histidine kinase MtrB